MKTTTTIKQTLLALTIALSIVSCKKDKKDDPIPPPVEVKAMTFTELKALSTGASVKVPDAKKITGIVISDVSAKNIDSKTVVLQEATGQTGLIVTFDAAQTFAVGDQLEVIVSNQTLAQTNGEIVLQNVPAANAKKTGTGTITAKATTIADINTNKATIDGTLVTIAATELSGGSGKYTGTLTIKDASGTATSNVLTGAAFAGTDYPVSVSSITGIVRISSNATRIDIRKTDDVVSGAITRTIVEDFSGFAFQNGSTSRFDTNLGTWIGGSTGISYSTAVGTDVSFTTAGRNYLYISGTTDYVSNYIYTQGSTNVGGKWGFAGVKTVTVTFAGSTASTLAATDYLKIRLEPISLTGNGVIPPSSIQFSTEYHTTGQFNSFTYTMPTQEQLVADGVTATAAANWLKSPKLAFLNVSKSSAANTPIVIEKIVFGYTE